MELPETPELPRCKVCNSENRFLIQKEIDSGELPADISIKYNISHNIILNHINRGHRSQLLAWGAVDYVVRKKSVDIAETLNHMIEKLASKIDSPDFKNADLIKAIELFSKLEGRIVDKHEVMLKKSVDDEIRDYLNSE